MSSEYDGPSSYSQMKHTTSAIIERMETQIAADRAGGFGYDTAITLQNKLNEASAAIRSQAAMLNQKLAKETDPQRKQQLQALIQAGQQKLAGHQERLDQYSKGLVEFSNTSTQMIVDSSQVLGKQLTSGTSWTTTWNLLGLPADGAGLAVA
jgi:hypothetical protein